MAAPFRHTSPCLDTWWNTLPRVSYITYRIGLTNNEWFSSLPNRGRAQTLSSLPSPELIILTISSNEDFAWIWEDTSSMCFCKRSSCYLKNENISSSKSRYYNFDNCNAVFRDALSSFEILSLLLAETSVFTSLIWDTIKRNSAVGRTLYNIINKQCKRYSDTSNNRHPFNESSSGKSVTFWII